MKHFLGFAVALILLCIPPCALAQGGSMMQGAGSTAAGAAKQAGENAAGQAMQNMGMISPSASPAATESPQAVDSSAVQGSPAAAPSAAQMPGAIPSVGQIPGAVPSPPAY